MLFDSADMNQFSNFKKSVLHDEHPCIHLLTTMGGGVSGHTAGHSNVLR